MVRSRSHQSSSSVSKKLQIRVMTLPALRYEGFDLSSLRVGNTYEMEHRLAALLIERGFAEPVRPRSESAHAAHRKDKR